ncbi:hypothetical protein [Roseibium sp. MB-4]
MTDLAGRSDNTANLMRQSVYVALFGALVYAVMASGFFLTGDSAPDNPNIYDEYYFALLDGHFDLPPRVVQFEGHYTADGTAYLYHGIAPLLTRYAFGWIWPFAVFPMTGFSIWLWAVIGTFTYQMAFFKIAEQHLGRMGETGPMLARLLGFAVWFASPGMIVVANGTFYHEPISVGYAATGVFVLCCVLVIQRKLNLSKAVLILATCAAISLHARPNIAIGLYAGAMFAVTLLATAKIRRNAATIVAALSILGFGGTAYLGLNALKFGEATQSHSSFQSGSVQYGFAYWGMERADGERAEAFEKYGRFNIGRLPHNIVIYTLDLPDIGPALSSLGEHFRSWAVNTLAADVGHIRVEHPHAGLIYLLPFWLALAVSSFWAQASVWKQFGPALAATLIAAGLTLTYATITLRYRVDLWPAIAVLALIGMSAIMPKLAAGNLGKGLQHGLAALFLLGAITTTYISMGLLKLHANSGFGSLWTFEVCKTFAQTREFTDADIVRICREPRGVL